MKKNILLKSLMALLFSLNLNAMFNPTLFSNDPESKDASWRSFDCISENLDLDIELINGGFISLSWLNAEYEKYQLEEMEKVEETFKYGIPGCNLRKDIYSNPYIEKLSCPVINCTPFKSRETVARINDNGPLYHLNCLVDILRENPNYDNAEYLMIYFLWQ